MNNNKTSQYTSRNVAKEKLSILGVLPAIRASGALIFSK